MTIFANLWRTGAVIDGPGPPLGAEVQQRKHA